MDLFERALEVPHARRGKFLEHVCGENASLRDELSSLLQAGEAATDYFDNLAEAAISPAYGAVLSAAPETLLLPELQAALGNRYRILHCLGGGMSCVFLAEETKLGRKVVIKALPPELVASAGRFRREIRVAARLQHPHIVPLLTTGSAGAFLYYTMPFVAGESLRARLAREGPLPIATARTVWRDVLDALAHAHACGVVHRDIKPGNILLVARNALVSDFGIARAVEREAPGGDATETGPGVIVGTPAYMAPEQATADKTADHRVDIYAAGLVMYEMLEGRLPFACESARQLTLARLTRDASPIGRPDCPPALAALIMRCLARAPAARPQTVEALLAELDAIPVTGERADAAHARSPRRVRLVDLFRSLRIEATR
jgi:serine/threonine-protein kinase